MRNWILFLFLACSLALPAAAEEIVFLAPDWGMQIVDTENPDTYAKALPDKAFTENGITFNISYLDGAGTGFYNTADGANRRARLEEVLSYIADVINMSGTLDVQVNASESDGTGALAFAGTYYAATAGFQNGTSLRRLLEGSKPFSAYAEIEVTVDFGFTWNTGTGAPSASQLDFRSVLLHEMTHGLGFASLATSTGTSQITGKTVYTVFDGMMVRGLTDLVLFSGAPPAFHGTALDLVSNDLEFDGSHAFSYYGQGVAPGLYAPSPFVAGSSLEHWDTGNIVGGAVMEHQYTYGEMRREYSPVDIGALIDLGYTEAATPGEGEGEGEVPSCELTSVAISSPTGNVTITSGTSVSVPLTCTVVINDTGACSANPVEVVYRINNVVVGSSSDASSNYLVTVSRTAGTYTLKATATISDTGQNLTVQRSFTVIGPTPAQLTVTPGPAEGYDFGNVVTGQSLDATFTIENTGDTATSGTASVSGTGFSIVGAADYSLGSGAAATITVRFQPADQVDYAATLTFTGDPDGDIAVALSGSGVKDGFLGCGPEPGTHGRRLGDVFVMITAAAALLGFGRRRRA